MKSVKKDGLLSKFIQSRYCSWFAMEALLFYSLGCLISGWFGYQFDRDHNKEDRVEIIKKNTEVMKAIGGAAATNSAVSDLLLRLTHYTNNHKKSDNYFFCPECSKDEISIAEEYFVEQDEFPPDDVDPSHDQIISDLEQIRTGVDSITFGHLNQMKKVEIFINQFKNREEAVAGMWFGGIECE